MPIEMRTHGYDWQKKVRECPIFVALITPAWHRDRLAQRQYTYARQLQKTIVLLVQQGARLPDAADEYPWIVWETVEEVAQVLERIEQGWVPGEEA